MPRYPHTPHRATIYGEGASGAFDEVLIADLPCHLATRRTVGATGFERVELAQDRALIWNASDYELPTEHVQVAVAGFAERWNVAAGTVIAPPWEDGSQVYWRASVVRVQ